MDYLTFLQVVQWIVYEAVVKFNKNSCILPVISYFVIFMSKKIYGFINYVLNFNVLFWEMEWMYVHFS
jgi:hypothetical protein